MDLVGKGIVATHLMAETCADFPRPELVQFLGKWGHNHLGVRVAHKGVSGGGMSGDHSITGRSHIFQGCRRQNSGEGVEASRTEGAGAGKMFGGHSVCVERVTGRASDSAGAIHSGRMTGAKQDTDQRTAARTSERNSFLLQRYSNALYQENSILLPVKNKCLKGSFLSNFIE